MSQKILFHGAEAKIVLVDREFLATERRGSGEEKFSEEKKGFVRNSDKKFIIKQRIPKSYRLKELDEKIRKLRTRSEAKLIEKASKIIKVPKIIKSDENTKEIIMDFVRGKRLSDCLNDFPLGKQLSIIRKVGELAAILHNSDIIHGDLTTSNMIIKKNGNSYDEIFFIDFGLGFISRKVEDKAVDIHLIMEALEAKHFENFVGLKKAFLQGYKIRSREFQKILERFKKVEQRGRNKEQY